MWVCPACEGKGNIVLVGCIGVPCVRLPEKTAKQFWCPQCSGTGEINFEQMEAIELGEKVKNYRLTILKLTLREWSFRNGIRPSDESRFEQGIYKDIDEEVLEILKNFWRIMMGVYPEG